MTFEEQVKPCGCVVDDDPDVEGVIIATCPEHHRAWLTFEYRLWLLVRAELDAVVLGKGTRAAPARKEGAVFGAFAIARPA